MESKSDNQGGFFSRHMKRLGISTKLTLVYGALLGFTLFFSSAITLSGLYNVLYHQAEVEMNISIMASMDYIKHLPETDSEAIGDIMENVSPEVGPNDPDVWDRLMMLVLPAPEEVQHHSDEDLYEHLNGGHEAGINFGKDSQNNNSTGDMAAGQGPDGNDSQMANGDALYVGGTKTGRKSIMPGVVLRVVDQETGQVLYNSDINFFSTDDLIRCELPPDQQPLFADRDFRVDQVNSAILVYHKVIPMYLRGKTCDMHFFRTITAEYHLLQLIQKILIIVNLLGLAVALVVGFVVIRRTIKPIGDLTEAAKAIQVSDLGKRVDVSPAGDELTEMARTFNGMLDRIQTGFAAQQRFVSDASHELRTPVTVIRGYADMLDRWGSSDPAVLAEAIEAIKSESQDMQELIENLLFLARTDQKRQIIKKQPLDMGELIEDATKKMAVATHNHQLELVACESGMVMADRVAMKQLMRIFLENAVKYTPEGGHINVNAKCINGFMKLEISDDGIGIAPEDQDKIFQRFYRVDASRTKAAGTPGGTGLGLSIARWIADCHDIGITVKSALGEGTTFIFMIPLYDEHEGKAEDNTEVKGEADNI